MKQKKAIVFFSAGLGDALLLVPVVRQLKEQGYHVSGFFNSEMPCHALMQEARCLDELIEARSSTQHALLSLRKMAGYDLAVLNFFAATKKNLLTASLMAREVITNRGVSGLRAPGVKITLLGPEPGIHDAQQNLRLVGDHTFTLQDLALPVGSAPKGNLPASYTALQVSSGNAGVAYKNWPVEHWRVFLSKFFHSFPERKLVLLGTGPDVPVAQELAKEFSGRLISLAGQTNIPDLMAILAGCSLFIGLDGAMMHLAVAYGRPTFTIWGPSSDVLYGYEQFDPVMHRCVRLPLACYPCNAWLEPNTTKTAAPELCPDHACTWQLSADQVFTQFAKYVTSLPAHVW